jgi:hypothetical protein
MFKSIQEDLFQVEDMVYQWLDENSGIQIIQLAQSEIGSRRGRDIAVTIVCSESPDSR